MSDIIGKLKEDLACAELKIEDVQAWLSADEIREIVGQIERAEAMRDALNGWSRKDMPDFLKLIGSLGEPSSIEVAYEYASLCCVTLIQSALKKSKDGS